MDNFTGIRKLIKGQLVSYYVVICNTEKELGEDYLYIENRQRINNSKW